ncbi:MAG TPA: membrane dipeptidase [Candidatus Limnocylindrales bacterium]|nr:membrane dipeptidase [Candidatus Limnocylindrales bacterium]
MDRTVLRAGLLAGGAAAAAATVGPVLDAAVGRIEGHLCRVHRSGPYPASERARALHATIPVTDLHADSLLFGRDLAVRGSRAHADVPRLLEGGVALQVLAAATRISRHVKLTGNDDRGDDVRWLAIAQRWPVRTWSSLLERARHLAARARDLERRSDGRFRVIATRDDLDRLLAERAAGARVVGGLLAIEGAQALEGDPEHVGVAFEAGYRMISPAHFFDTAFGGSAHGARRGGLTPLGRDMVARMEALGMVVDVAHASEATIDDVLAVATRPVVASHTGVRGTFDSPRNLSDAQLRGLAATGGVVGIGFWDAATGGSDAAAIVRAIGHAVDVAGPDHVALGSDFDGAVPTPFDATGLPMLTDALLSAGFAEPVVRGVMGENAIRVLRAVLPPGRAVPLC